MSEDLIADDKDALAGEYVLGTLDANERAAAQELLAADREFAAKVRHWERRLGELHLMVEPVEPEPESNIWQRIKAKLPEPVTPEPAPEPAKLDVDVAEVAPEPRAETAAEPEAGPPEQGGGPGQGFVLVSESSPETVKSAEPAPTEPEFASLESGLSAVLSDAIAPETTAAETAPPAVESATAQDQSAETALSELEQPIEAAAAGPENEVSPGTTLRPSMVPSDELPPFPVGRRTPGAAAGEHDEKLRTIQRHLVGWRAVAVVMTVAVFAAAGLLALWRYEPERVPPALRPLKLMRLVGITLDMPLMHREPAPPESQFDE